MLDILIFTPFGAALTIAVLGQNKQGLSKIASLSVSVLTFCFVLSLGGLWQDHISHISLSRAWIPSLASQYQLQLDGFSYMLLLITSFICMIAIMVAWRSIKNWDRFGPLILLTLSGLMGVFLARDLLLFYIFWELMLIPLYFLLSQWGSPHSEHSATRFLLYTVCGSLFMLAGIICLYQQVGQASGQYSFAFDHLLSGKLVEDHLWIFLAFFIGFAVKVPMFPLHLWAPKTYKEAHPAVTIILSGAMANAGIYGILRIGVFISPLSQSLLANIIMGLAAIGAIYTGLIAYQQQDMRSVAAYSSISHMNLAIMACFAMQLQALNGALLQLVAHSLSITGIFAIIAMLQARRFNGELAAMGGLFNPMPRLGGMLLFFFIASAGLPGLGNFSSDILMLVGTYQSSPLWAILAAMSIVVGIAYFLRCYERAMLGPLLGKATDQEITTKKVATSHCVDLNGRELILSALLVIGILWLGLYPTSFLQPFSQIVSDILSAQPLFLDNL